MAFRVGMSRPLPYVACSGMYQIRTLVALTVDQSAQDLCRTVPCCMPSYPHDLVQPTTRHQEVLASLGIFGTYSHLPSRVVNSNNASDISDGATHGLSIHI